MHSERYPLTPEQAKALIDNLQAMIDGECDIVRIRTPDKLDIVVEFYVVGN